MIKEQRKDLNKPTDRRKRGNDETHIAGSSRGDYCILGSFEYGGERTEK